MDVNGDEILDIVSTPGTGDFKFTQLLLEVLTFFKNCLQNVNVPALRLGWQRNERVIRVMKSLEAFFSIGTILDDVAPGSWWNAHRTTMVPRASVAYGVFLPKVDQPVQFLLGKC